MNKRNGKLTKREIVRRMWTRAVDGETSSRYSIGYMARRLDLTYDEVRYFIHALTKLQIVAAYEDKHSIVFFG